MKKLKTIDKYLGTIDRKIKLLSRINPSNADSQRKKFLYLYIRGRAYNPAFTYKPANINLKEMRRELSVLRINIPKDKDEKWFFAKQLKNKRRRIMKKIKNIRYRGLPKFAALSRELFGAPSQEQIRYAQSCFTPKMASYFSKIEDSISDRETASRFYKRIGALRLPWQVKLRKNMSSKAGLDSRSKYLLIKTGERFAPEEIESLIVHEIETHIFRKENGLLQPFPHLFSEGFAGPPTTEEGLAFYNETLFKHDPRRMLIVAGRTIAAHLARRKSFYEVFCKLHALGLPPTYAWNITLRVKRGISDTSRPGAFTKDHHYLKGYLDVKKFLENGGDARRLYIGKLNISNAESLVKFGVTIKEPKYIPRHFRN